jgi:hypothetical protein
VTKVTVELHRPVQDAPRLRVEAGGMHGNFDPTAQLDDDGAGATVTGWVAWDGKAGDPSSCHVRVEVKQTSGPGSRKAYGKSDSYQQAPKDQHVAWSAYAEKTTGSDDLEPGAADVKAWIEDSSRHVFFQWDTTITLDPPS